MGERQRETPSLRQTYRKASGDAEFYTDGTTVNAYEGLREMKVGIFAKRRRGEPSSAKDYDKRSLPAPHVRVVFAAIENSKRFGARWGRWASRLGIHDTSKLSVLADGARWIWEEAEIHFAGAEGVLYIYHAVEHLGDTAKVLYGEGMSKAAAWRDAGHTALLQAG